MQHRSIALEYDFAAFEFRLLVLFVNFLGFAAEQLFLVHFSPEVLQNNWLELLVFDVEDVPGVVELPLLLDLEVAGQLLPVVVYYLHSREVRPYYFS